MEARLLKVNDVCRALALGRSSVYKLVRTGKLRPVRVFDATRFRTEDVEALIAELANENAALDQPKA